MTERYYEVRLNDNGTLDEVVGERCDVHLEQMSNTHWWMEVGLQHTGKRIHVNFHSKATIRANYSDESDTTRAAAVPDNKTAK